MNKNDIEIELARLVDAAEGGEVCPIEAFAQLRELADLAKQAMDQIKPVAMAELELHDKEGKQVGGKVYTLSNTSKYVYEYPTVIGDAVSYANALKKEYEALAKKQTLGISYATEQGELIEVVPATKLTTTTIKATKAKGGGNV